MTLLSMMGTTAMTASVPVVVQPKAGNPFNTDQLLQFTSDGHILGFTAGGMYAANGSHALHVDFVNANIVRPQADSAKNEARKAALLSRVTYANLWDGVNLTYTEAPGEIYTTTYTLAPGADAKNIRLRYNVPLTLNSDGTLGIAFDNGTMAESAPVAWQEIDGRRVMVDVTFQISGYIVSFALGEYDPRYTLTIDPSLAWNTFLGGLGWESGIAITLDGNGNIYVAGVSDAAWPWGCSPTPCTVQDYSDTYDAFVAKMDSSGNLLWNTFLGSSGYDQGLGITVDGSGNVYITGVSEAAWSCQPVTCTVRAYSSSRDAFVVKLDSTGVLLWNTFLGGSGSAESEGWSIALDGSGNIYVVGYSNVPWSCSPTACTVRTYTFEYDAFVAKLDSSGNLFWNTFLGGGGTDSGLDIVVDSNGNVYVSGWSSDAWSCSPVLCTVQAYSGGTDAFAAKLDSSGGLLWNTFLGGSGRVYGYGIAVDGSGNIYTSGSSDSNWGCSPTSCTVRAYSGGEDTYVAKLDSSGGLLWNTFMGGGGNDDGYNLAVDGSGDTYLTGYSSASWGSPLRSFSGGGDDAFVAEMNSSGNLVWNTFLGGSESDEGFGIALDGEGNIYVRGNSDDAWGCSPTSCTARSYTNDDAFVAKLYKSFTISGNAGSAGATLSYIDGSQTTVTADGSGIYTLTVPDGWSGTVTPSKPGYTFSPSNRDYSASPVTTDLTGQDFTATQDTYTLTINSLHGTVTRNPDKATYTYGEVVQLTANPTAGWNFANWTGDATGTTNPVSVTMNGNKAVTANYVQLFSISGIAGVGGAILSYTDGTPKTTTADGNGNYSFNVSYNWSGTVTPSKTGYTFSPTDKTYVNILANKSGENYIAYASIHVTIAGTSRGDYDIPPKGSMRLNYAGVDSGPMAVHSSGAVPIIAALRDAWAVDGTTFSFAQLMGLPASQVSDTYVFPAYNNVSLNEQLRIGNVDTSDTVVTVTIGGVLRGTYPLGPSQSTRVNFAGVDSGPVIVKGTPGVNIIAAERDAWSTYGVTTSFVQLMGMPASQLSDTYVFPAYNNVTLNEQLRIGNVDTSDSIVTVTIGGVLKGTYPLGPNESTRVNYAGVDSGPVIVQGTPGVHIIAAERDAWSGSSLGTTTSFSQLMGLPAGQLSDTYLFPAYNNVSLNEQLRIGNVDASNTAVKVTIGGVLKGTYPLGSDESIRINYAGVDSGPVVVQGTSGVHIIVAERDAWSGSFLSTTTSFVQLMGLPSGQLSDTYLFPAYNNVTLNEQLRFGVP